MKNNVEKNTVNESRKKVRLFNNRPVLLISLKSFVIIFGFFFLIRYLDNKGYFDPDQRNNHTKKKWDAYYDFTEKNNVDVILVGNSHLYSGINPKNLSSALGCNAFILASPGTNIADSYFGLKEAMKRSNPKVVVVETYGIREFDPYTLNKNELSSQFKSFYARKDFATKIQSMPYLFHMDNYLYAWSNTIRNHDFIFNDTAQLNLNKKLIKDKEALEKKKKKLYLGRYVRFQTGIEEEIIKKYDSIGPPVKGEEYTYNAHTKKYVNKIIDLCKKENVELVFLTLPMYEKHISNYSTWEKKISELIGQENYNWLNLQKLPGYSGFGTYAFENTYEQNQHMTYNGSLLATYKLASYIGDSLNIELPSRSKNKAWKKMFYGQEGYFENYNPSKNDKKNVVLCSNKKLRNIELKNVLLIAGKKNNKLIAKIDKTKLSNLNYKSFKLRLAVKLIINGNETASNVDLIFDQLHSPKNEVLFVCNVKKIIIKEIVDGMFVSE